jgi:threonine dehydratase
VLSRAIPMRDGQRIAAVVSGGNIAIEKLRTLLG